MSEDIRAGDVVVLVNDSPGRRTLGPLPFAAGAVLRVAKASIHPASGIFTLGLSGYESRKERGLYVAFHADRFRKIDAPKTELSERIRACKPTRVEA